MASRSSRSFSRSGALLSVTALSIAIGGGCRQNTPVPQPAPPSSAHPAAFVHPPTPPEPAPQARPECSHLALGHVAARIRETQAVAARALEPPRSHRPQGKARKWGCGSPAMTELEREVKGDLSDRVRICVAQDGPLDAEWNLLDASLASLGVCVDCARPTPARSTDCQRTARLITQAETEAAARGPTP